MNPERPLLRHLFYWVLPALYMSALVALYFSGRPELVDVIAPRVAPWDYHGNRELGLLEFSEHLILALIAVIFLRAAWQPGAHLRRAGCLLLGVGFVLFLLEELDYGLHFYEWWRGEVVFRGARNLHNRGDLTQILKVAADTVNVVWFIVLPLLALRLRHRWVSYLAPPLLILSTVAVALGVSETVHTLAKSGFVPLVGDGEPRLALHGNLSEFRETTVFYVWLLYVHEVVTRRRWPGDDGKTA
ncbi:MAG: hypothetical protein ACRETN_04220 [Nevskiales bacterium]